MTRVHATLQQTLHLCLPFFFKEKKLVYCLQKDFFYMQIQALIAAAVAHFSSEVGSR